MSDLKEVLVPDIGGDEVEVTELLVSVGDQIEVDQSLISVEGDKAAMEVPSSLAGTVKELKLNVGDTVSEGSVILLLEVASSDDAPEESAHTQAAPNAAENAPEAGTEEAAPTKGESIPVTVPDIGGDEVEVTEILVAVGDEIETEQSLISVEGDKAAMEVPSSAAGVITAIKIAVGDKVSQGDLIVEIASSTATPAAAATKEPAINLAAPAPSSTPVSKPPVPHHPSAGTSSNSGKVHATPSVRRLAREFGVDLAQVNGTGRKQRILKEDVQAYVKYELSRPKASAATATGGGNGLQVIAQPKVDFAKFGEIETVELSRIQKISGPSLHRNWVTIPHVTQFDEADTTELEAFRKEQNAIAAKQEQGYKLSPLVFMLKAAAKALELHPTFNSSLSDDGEKLILKKYINIGIAVDTPNGLVVPVIRDVNKKGIVELSKEMAEISKKARAGKLTGADMQGSSFTISSLGGIGGTQFTPIVNAPDVAILGVSRSEMKPKWNGKEFEPRLMVPLALSYDHRVIDGADGARFITTLSGVLSDLRRLIL